MIISRSSSTNNLYVESNDYYFIGRKIVDFTNFYIRVMMLSQLLIKEKNTFVQCKYENIMDVKIRYVWAYATKVYLTHCCQHNCNTKAGAKSVADKEP